MSVAATKNRGLLIGFAAAAAFAAMGLMVHLSRAGLPSTELVFIRAVSSALLLGPMVRRKIPGLVGRGTMAVWGRSAFGSLGVLCYFWTLQHTLVATSTLIADSTPLFVSLFLAVTHRRLPSWTEVFGVAMSMAGILVMSQGMSTASGDGAASSTVVLVGLFGAGVSALAYLSLSRAAAKFSAQEIVFCLSLLLAAASLAVPSATWQWPLTSDLLLITAIVVLSLGAQLLLTWTYATLHPVLASIISLTACLWGAAFEALADGSQPSAHDWLGYALILCGIAGMKVLPQLRGRFAAAPAPQQR